MKKKIFIYYIVLILIGLSVTGFFISQLTQKFYKYEVENRLINAISLIEHHLASDISLGVQVDYNRVAKEYANIINGDALQNPSYENTKIRITFINSLGVVLGESQTDRQEMENHLNRKEVQEAIQGRIGKDLRFSATLKVDFLYIAMLIDNSDVVARVSIPLVQLKAFDRIILFYSLAGTAAGLLLTLLLALRFSTFLAQPINELITVSKEISMGNYSKRVNIQSKDEIGQLGETFNEMALQLEKTVAELTDKNVKVDSIMNSMISGIVAVDSSFRVILINAMASEIFSIKGKADIVGTNIIEIIRNNHVNMFLRESIEKNVSLVNEINIGSPEDRILRIYTNPIRSKDSISANSGGIIFIQDITNIRKLEQIRTEFVSNVTHELKTPLTSIRGFIETLRSGAIKDRDVSERFLEIIDIEAERLYMLINDILQLSEIENKHKDSNIGIHNLKSIVEHTIAVLEGAAEKKNITLSTEINHDIKIVANKDRIKQMLINLIENGIKYNVDNGSVFVKAYKQEGRIVISVKDTGIGIAQEHLSRIFERFYRVDKGRSRSMGGTGLGLSIVKHIVNLYSGDIKVNSSPGKGTEFIISLPA